MIDSQANVSRMSLKVMRPFANNEAKTYRAGGSAAISLPVWYFVSNSDVVCLFI
jgi:hypothetical protein